MSTDLQARYDILVREVQRERSESARGRDALAAMMAERNRLARLLGLADVGGVVPPQRTMEGGS